MDLDIGYPADHRGRVPITDLIRVAWIKEGALASHVIPCRRTDIM